MNLNKHAQPMTEQPGDGAASGSGAASAPAPAPAADNSGASAPAPAPAASEKSLAQQAAGDTASKPINELIPEKFRVSKDGGEFDADASTRKLIEAHANLEKRLGSGDAPPKAPEDYKLEGLPQHVNIDELKKDERYQGFLKGAHALGLSNAQVSYVLNRYISHLEEMPSGMFTLEQCETALKEVWAKDGEFESNTNAACRAMKGLAKDTGLSMDDIEDAGLANNPVFFRLMAGLKQHMSEDAPPNSHDISQSEQHDIAQMRQRLGSMSEKDPEYAGLRAKVDGWYAKRYGSAAVS